VKDILPEKVVNENAKKKEELKEKVGPSPLFFPEALEFEEKVGKLEEKLDKYEKYGQIKNPTSKVPQKKYGDKVTVNKPKKIPPPAPPGNQKNIEKEENLGIGFDEHLDDKIEKLLKEKEKEIPQARGKKPSKGILV